MQCNPQFLLVASSSVQSEFALVFIASINQHPLTTKHCCHAMENFPYRRECSLTISVLLLDYSKGGIRHKFNTYDDE